MWAELVGQLLLGLSELWTPGDKPVKRRRALLIIGGAAMVSFVLALIAYSDVL